MNTDTNEVFRQFLMGYDKATKNKAIFKPIAWTLYRARTWALYQTWKWADAKKKTRTERR